MGQIGGLTTRINFLKKIIYEHYHKILIFFFLIFLNKIICSRCEGFTIQ